MWQRDRLSRLQQNQRHRVLDALSCSSSTRIIVPLAIIRDFASEAMWSRNFVYSNATQLVEGISLHPQIILVEHAFWLPTLFVASATMLLCGLVSAMIGSWRKGPDILDTISSLMRDKPHVAEDLALNVEGMDWTRWLNDVVTRLGDTTTEDPPAHIEIGTPSTQNIAMLKQGRLHS